MMKVLAAILTLSCASLLCLSFYVKAPHAGRLGNPPSSSESWPFIDYENNRIFTEGQDHALNHFFNKLDSLQRFGEGQLNIVHMGGSHVQAGVLSQRLYENLCALSPGLEGGRGFYFPNQLVQSNGPVYTRVKYTGEWNKTTISNKKDLDQWSLSGINALSETDSAQIKMWSFGSDSLNKHFDRIKIFHLLDSASYEIEMDSLMRVSSVKHDSLLGFSEYTFQGAPDSLIFRVVKRKDAQKHFIFQGCLFEQEDGGISYHALGVNGASTKSWLRPKNLSGQLTIIKPDLVLFGIGINDAYSPTNYFDKAAFMQRYDSLVQLVRSANPEVSIIFVTNNDSYYKRKYVNKNGLVVQSAMYELAEKHQACVWDLFSVMGGLNSISTWEQNGLAKRDKIHFTTEGYTLQADLMYLSLRDAYGDFLEKKYIND